MTKIRLRYVHEFIDRHGKVRRYVRLPGRKRVALRGAPGTAEFMEAYQAALAGSGPGSGIGAARTLPGTINAAVVSYLNSSAFASLAPETRRVRRNISSASAPSTEKSGSRCCSGRTSTAWLSPRLRHRRRRVTFSTRSGR
jgi:hypothetical protein